jgi:acyl-CoA synthetase (AMP-forming)/AMP-acid ligase II
VSALARALTARGIGRGDRVAVLAWNGLELLETTFATAGIGAILVPLNCRLARREIEEILRRSGAKLVVADPSLFDTGLTLGPRYEAELERHAGEFVAQSVPDDAVAQLYFTSGTTGRPKGVQLTHRNVVAHARAAIAELGLSESDVWAHVAPMFHLADAWATLAITAVGGAHAMLPRFDARAALELFARDRATITNLVPTMLNLVVRHPDARSFDLSSFRLVLSGGAAIAPVLVRETIELFGCEYAQTYGMTETSPYLAISLLSEPLRALSEAERFRWICKTGRPFAGVELRVVGDDGRDVPADERTVGEIRVRGASVTPGYFEDEAATREAFEDGWLKTGDLAVIDAHGYVTVVDRTKDVIKTGGESVYSTEVEAALAEHPSVLEVAVFGVPDPLWGESVRAAVVLRAGRSATPDELVAQCRSSLAPYKIPRAIVFLEELPRTGSGKIAKRMLRERR